LSNFLHTISTELLQHSRTDQSLTNASLTRLAIATRYQYNSIVYTLLPSMTIVLHENMTSEQIGIELNSLYSKTADIRTEELMRLKNKRRKLRDLLTDAFDLKGKNPLDIQREWRNG